MLRHQLRFPNRADVVQPNKKSKNYLERMGIKPSHIATLTEKSGATCVGTLNPTNWR